MAKYIILLAIGFLPFVKPDIPINFTEEQLSPFLKNVNLFYWKPKAGAKNFGDELSPVIVSKILELNSKKLCSSKTKSEHLLAIGSILSFAKTNYTIWGSGVNGKINKSTEYKFTDLDVRAVRGPLTRQFLLERQIQVPEIYGDPALLISYFFPRKPSTNKKESSYAIIPHLFDLELASVKNLTNVISPLKPWHLVVSRILESNFVISASLHGLIIAEAYGIPARRIKFQNIETDFKYEDYILGTGRTDTRYVETVQDALDMGGMPPIPKEFDYMKILEAFPLDLWTHKCLK